MSNCTQQNRCNFEHNSCDNFNCVHTNTGCKYQELVTIYTRVKINATCKCARAGVQISTYLNLIVALPAGVHRHSLKGDIRVSAFPLKCRSLGLHGRLTRSFRKYMGLLVSHENLKSAKVAMIIFEKCHTRCRACSRRLAALQSFMGDQQTHTNGGSRVGPNG